jgi:hypothetical protein
MADTKELLAQATAALDAERLAASLAAGVAKASLDAATAQIADLKAQIAALNPWNGIDKTATVDVTAAAQQALDAGFPAPAGRYLIDPLHTLVIRKSMALDPNAVFIAKPNNATRYCVLSVVGTDITVTGGQIIGDRLQHAYVTGSTSEWCYGAQLSGDRITIDGLKVSQCPGDGLGVSGKDIVIRNVVSTQNRRQGMSVFTAPGLKVYDSEFSYTGAYLTDGAAPNGPCAGVDVEPDAMATVDATFERCTFPGNRAGLLAWLRSEVGGSLNITMKDCATGGNANGLNAKALAGSIHITVTGGKSVSDRSSTARIDAGATLDISGVTVTGLSSKYALQAVNGGVIHQSAMVYA